jgi:hypothetical protein
MTLAVTRHAVDRYIERVAAVSHEAALAAIMSHERALEAAANFAGKASVTVRLRDGVRFVICNHRVLTVLGAA